MEQSSKKRNCGVLLPPGRGLRSGTNRLERQQQPVHLPRSDRCPRARSAPPACEVKAIFFQREPRWRAFNDVPKRALIRKQGEARRGRGCRRITILFCGCTHSCVVGGLSVFSDGRLCSHHSSCTDVASGATRTIIPGSSMPISASSLRRPAICHESLNLHMLLANS